MSGGNSARRWAFIAGKPFLPSAENPLPAGLGGTEQAVINLTAALAADGDDVTVYGATIQTRNIRPVRWLPGAPGPADIYVAINDARRLPADAARPVIWFHNEVALAREIRRGRLPSLLRHRPVAVFIGTEQARGASALLPFRRRKIIPYGLSEQVLSMATASAPPPPHALFTSQAYRGLSDIISMWQADIAPAMREAALFAFIAEQDVETYRALATHAGITIAPRIPNDAVLARLVQSRVLLAPGHVAETFCLAAAEAIALGVPVITLGTGSLKERVRHGVDGFVCHNYREFAARTRDLLTDDELWLKLHANGVASRRGRGWAAVAEQWKSLLF